MVFVVFVVFRVVEGSGRFDGARPRPQAFSHDRPAVRAGRSGVRQVMRGFLAPDLLSTYLR
ncbi:hypothetical protein [Microtetraspora sp. NBRC 16547]|uniref:hypothetical protein n=1 Tax=Microtetraspora sp. NBRC 16547 TaxID=3030993 RepID=UPI0025574D78|nr:hypothetical protein [Microtetraspora sp. NBRC 16547]